VWRVTAYLLAALTATLKLKRDVGNAVLGKLLAHKSLYLCRIRVRDNVHSRIICASVHAPNVHVMNADNSIYTEDMLLKLVSIHALGSFGKKEIYDLTEIFNSVYKNKHRNTYRHNRIEQIKVGKSHNYRADKHDYPSKNVLKHMKIDRSLIE
jgi:hypothetical protein